MNLEVLATGYGLLEGPRVDDQNRLCFSDVPNGGVFRRSFDATIETVIPRRKGVGGIAFNRGGGLVVSGRGLILFNDKNGETQSLFTEWDGKPLNGINDIQPDHQGSVYCGTINFDPLAANPKPTPGSLFRVDPPNQAIKLWDGIEVSNGMGFSPDRKLLYHCDSPTSAVWVYDVAADRGVHDRRIFAKLPEGMPDGMAVDVEGGLWVAAVYVGEVIRFKPDGTLDRRIKIPAKMVTSLTFGGPDLQDLYVVTADNTDHRELKGTVFRMRSDVPGLPVPKAAF
jgi:D-xylonolactonase